MPINSVPGAAMETKMEGCLNCFGILFVCVIIYITIHFIIKFW